MSIDIDRTDAGVMLNHGNTAIFNREADQAVSTRGIMSVSFGSCFRSTFRAHLSAVWMS